MRIGFLALISATLFGATGATADGPAEAVNAGAVVEQIESLEPVGAADTVTIVRTDLPAETLHVATRNGPRHYRVDDTTRIHSADEPLRLADLEPGQRVAVSARRAGDDFLATDIVVVAVGPEPPALPPTPRETDR